MLLLNVVLRLAICACVQVAGLLSEMPVAVRFAMPSATAACATGEHSGSLAT
jgi:hypothetical protein